MKPFLIAALVAAAFGYVAGTSAADGLAEKAERAHNAVVIATVEVAAKRYSVYPRPIGVADDPIPMFDLDQSYR